MGRLVAAQNRDQRSRALTSHGRWKWSDVTWESGLALAVGCCLYFGTGMLLGIPIYLALTRSLALLGYRADAASSGDQALGMLEQATTVESEVLGAIRYQQNEAILHTDTSLLPKRKLAWAAWNYHILQQQRERVALTYNMNILQCIDAPVTFNVTLNNSDAINPDKILKRIEYSHPMFTPESVAAQQRHDEINGTNRTWYCGAYWRNGFHEDGVVSAIEAVEHFNEAMYEELHLRRAS